MDKEEIVKEYELEIALENIVICISEKIDKYKATRDKQTKKELSVLLEDREKIYGHDEQTIKKYLKK